MVRLGGAGESGGAIVATPRSKTAILIWTSVVMIAVVAAAVLGAFWWSARALRLKMEAAFAEIRADGYPATLEELDAWHEAQVKDLPEGPAGLMKLLMEGKELEDAGVLKYPDPYTSEHSDWRRFVGDFYVPPVGAPLPEEGRRLLAKHVESKRAALNALHGAVGLRPVRMPGKPSEAAANRDEYRWPEWVKRLRTAEEMLAMEAGHHAEEGCFHGATESVRSIIGMTRVLNFAPDGEVALWTRHLGTRAAESALRRVLAMGSPSEADLKALAGDLKAAGQQDLLERALVAHRVEVLASFPKAPYNDSEGLEGVLNRPAVRGIFVAYGVSGQLTKDLDEYLAATRDAIASNRLAEPGRSAALVTRRNAVSGAWPTATSRAFTFEALGLLASTIRGALWTEARAGCLRVAVAVERFRLAKGGLPAKLDELVPKFLDSVPLDPFDGKPLRYSAIDEKSHKVWSIGWDGVDNGGNIDDDTFSVERGGVLAKDPEP